MARGEKPYRLYRGGRVKGKVPLQARAPARVERDGRGAKRYPGPGPARKPPRRSRLRFLPPLFFVVLTALLVAWAVTSYVSFRRGVDAANERLPPAARATLTAQEGLLLSRPTTILLLGTDNDSTLARRTARRADSIMLVRTDPDRHRLAFLSIPRDLRVEIPRHGTGKINAAMPLGGPTLAIDTVRALTGLPIHHVVLVNFAGFRTLIDELGGIDVDVPRPIVSNRFDCPFATDARCQSWRGWRFAKGRQRMNGRRALVYARIRENRLNPAENDLTRGERQQEVLQATTGKLTSVRTLARLPWIGEDVLAPLATDLDAWELMQLGWVKFRASSDRALHCRLGGSPQQIGGESFLIAEPENTAVIAMFTGRSAAQPPPPGTGQFGPGCVVGTGFE